MYFNTFTHMKKELRDANMMKNSYFAARSSNCMKMYQSSKRLRATSFSGGIAYAETWSGGIWYLLATFILTQLKKAMDRTQRDQEFEMDELRRKSDIELEELKRKNEQAQVTEQGKKKRASLEHEQKTVKASQARQTAVIETQEKIQVQEAEANALKIRTEIDAKRYRVETMSK